MTKGLGFLPKRKNALRHVGSAMAMSSAMIWGMAQQTAAQTVTYDVTIYTADIDYAATDADVYVTFFGTQSRMGVKSPTDLDNSGMIFNGATLTPIR